MRSWIMAGLVCTALCGCGDEEERTSQRKTAREKERALMSDPAAAMPELEARLSNWIEVKNGVATFNGARVGKSQYLLHAVPTTTPWLLTCGPDGMVVNFLALPPKDDDSDSDSLAKSLTEVALTNEQCKALMAPLGERLMAILAMPSSSASPTPGPATNP
jgi:hypothetical protein